MNVKTYYIHLKGFPRKKCLCRERTIIIPTIRHGSNISDSTKSAKKYFYFGGEYTQKCKIISFINAQTMFCEYVLNSTYGQKGYPCP